jgi:hypothetical protein
MKSRASLMRIDGTTQTRGALKGRFADVISATPRDILRDHYSGSKVEATGRCTMALHRPRRGVRTQSGTSFEGPRASLRPRGSHQPNQS